MVVVQWSVVGVCANLQLLKSMKFIVHMKGSAHTLFLPSQKDHRQWFGVLYSTVDWSTFFLGAYEPNESLLNIKKKR